MVHSVIIIIIIIPYAFIRHVAHPSITVRITVVLPYALITFIRFYNHA